MKMKTPLKKGKLRVRVNTSASAVGVEAEEDESIVSVNPAEAETTTEDSYSNLKQKLTTKNPIFQQVEIDALAESAKVQSELQNEMTKIRTEMKAKRIKYSGKFLETNLCDILDLIGDCDSFKDIIEKLEKLTESVNQKDPCITTTKSDPADEQEGFKKPLPPKTPVQYELPSSSSTLRPYTASSSTSSTTTSSSSSKAPRIYQPGEVLYSKNSSPVLVVPEAFTADKKGENFLNRLVTGVEKIKTTISHKRIMSPKVPTRSKTAKKVIATTATNPRVKSKRRLSSAGSASLSTKKNAKKKLKKSATTPRTPGQAVRNANEKLDWVPLKY